MQLCFADADCSLLSVKAKAKGTITHLQPAPPCLQNLRDEERREVNEIEHQKESKIEEIKRELKKRPWSWGSNEKAELDARKQIRKAKMKMRTTFWNDALSWYSGLWRVTSTPSCTTTPQAILEHQKSVEHLRQLFVFGEPWGERKDSSQRAEQASLQSMLLETARGRLWDNAVMRYIHNREDGVASEWVSYMGAAEAIFADLQHFLLHSTSMHGGRRRRLAFIRYQSRVMSGWVPESANPGDCVYHFFGTLYPFVLSQNQHEATHGDGPKAANFTLLGEAQVLGLSAEDRSLNLPEPEWVTLA